MSNQNHASGFNFVGGAKHVHNAQCDGPGCETVGLCLPVADGLYCVQCYQAAQDAVTDEMDEAFAISEEFDDGDMSDYAWNDIDTSVDEPPMYGYDSDNPINMGAFDHF